MSCNCGDCFDKDVLVLNEGEDGSDGLFGGYSARWIFDTNTAVSPASTKMRFNNGTLNLVNQIYLADNNGDGVDHTTFINSLNPFGEFGYVRIFKEDNSTVFWLGEITSITDNATYFTLGVTHIFSNGVFTNSANTVVSFIPISTSNSILNNTFTVGNQQANAWASIGNYSLPANTLTTNGDKIKIKACFSFVGFTSPNGYYKVQVDGADINASLTSYTVMNGVTNAFVEIDFARISNTSARIHLTNNVMDTYLNLSPERGAYETRGALNLTTNPVVFTFDARAAGGAETIYLDQLEVIKY